MISRWTNRYFSWTFLNIILVFIILIDKKEIFAGLDIFKFFFKCFLIPSLRLVNNVNDAIRFIFVYNFIKYLLVRFVFVIELLQVEFLNWRIVSILLFEIFRNLPKPIISCLKFNGEFAFPVFFKVFIFRIQLITILFIALIVLSLMKNLLRITQVFNASELHSLWPIIHVEFRYLVNIEFEPQEWLTQLRIQYVHHLLVFSWLFLK